MILDDLKNINSYFVFSPVIAEALNFVKTNLFKFEEKRYDINEYMFAVVETSMPKLIHDQKLEFHKKYVDIQYVIEGQDIIGWKNLLSCNQVYKEYQLPKDIGFYSDIPDFNIVLNQGGFVVFFPQDAHAPLCSKSSVKKCVVKIEAEKIMFIPEGKK